MRQTVTRGFGVGPKAAERLLGGPDQIGVLSNENMSKQA